MKNQWLIILGILSINAVVAANLTIQADVQQYADEKNEANFKGNVNVQLDDINVKSAKAVAKLDAKTKQLSTVKFMDNVYIYQVKSNRKNEVKADIVNLSLLNKIVQAQGNTQTIVTQMQQKTPLVTITADSQQYNTESKIMNVDGSVIVNYKGTTSYSDKGVAMLDNKGDIKELQLIGNVKIKQEENNFYADKYIYKADTGEATALGNVYSEMHNKDESTITVKSNFQQYNRNKNILIASNNVHVTYKDYKADGPKASVFPDEKTGRLNKVVFTGRSKITQGGRTIEADKITMTLEPKKFNAEGNVVSIIPNVNNIEQENIEGK